MAMVFVNFRTKQSGQAARGIAQRLRERLGEGVVFKDSESIRKGEDFEAALTRGLADSDAMVVVVGSQWVCPELSNDDDWVRREVEHALERKIPIVPAFVDGADASVVERERLPSGLKDLATKNGQIIRHGEQEFRDDIEMIARALAEHLGIPLQPVETTTASRPGSRAVIPQRGLCLGRDAQVATLVARLTAAVPSPVLVLGDAGMGKSTVTIAALHADAVRQQFGQRRYFVRLDGATSADAVVGSIAQVLRLSGDRLREQVVAWLAHAPVVLVLDNFESAWEPDRPAAEALLGEFATIESLALCVTVRGHERPDGFSLDAPLEIRALPPDVAATLFCRVANWDIVRAQDPALHVLLNPLGGVPLAIVLLAHAAEGTGDLTLLATEWQLRRTALLERPGAQPDRLSSWAVSLELSWESPRLGDAGRRVVAVLSRLPDGIALGDVEATLGAELLEGARLARKVGLAHEGDGRLRQLAPVREHVVTRHVVSNRDLGGVASFYHALARHLGDRPGGPGGKEAIDRLVPERGNLQVVLLAGLAATDPRPSIAAILALQDFYVFSGHEVPSCLVAARDRALAIGDVVLEARCAFALGVIHCARSSFEAACSLYDEALQLYSQVDDLQGQANCLHGRGDIDRLRADYDAAAIRQNEALVLYQSVGDALGQANCLKGLGDIERARSNRHAARICYERAIRLYREKDILLGQAHCIQHLGDICLSLSNHEAGRARYDEALSIYQHVGDVRGQASCIKRLGDIDFERSLYEASRARYREALAHFQGVGDTLGQANCILCLGDVALACSDFDLARAHCNEALPLFRLTSAVLGQANCIQALGDIEFELFNNGAARTHYNNALALYRRISEPYSIGQTLRRLALLAPTSEASRLLVGEARAVWTSIDRPDLVAKLDAEFGAK